MAPMKPGSQLTWVGLSWMHCVTPPGELTPSGEMIVEPARGADEDVDPAVAGRPGDRQRVDASPRQAPAGSRPHGAAAERLRRRRLPRRAGAGAGHGDERQGACAQGEKLVICRSRSSKRS